MIAELEPGKNTFTVEGRSAEVIFDAFIIYPLKTTRPIRLCSSSGDPSAPPTRITGPAATELTKGQEYTLTGEGDNLKWSYDANSDGKGSISIGSGSSLQFTVPTDVSPPNELALSLQGDNGTDERTYQIVSVATGITTPRATWQSAGNAETAHFTTSGRRIDAGTSGCAIRIIRLPNGKTVVRRDPRQF